MSKIALIAGKGKLPLIWAEQACKKGADLIAFPVYKNSSAKLQEVSQKVIPVNISRLGELIELFKQKQIQKVIMLGKVEKKHIYSDFKPDLEMQKFLANLSNLGDDKILQGLIAYFENLGFEVLPQSTFLEDLISKPGLLTEDNPSAELIADMEYGLKMAGEIGALGIGQTVLVKQKSVLAVEAVEGTDLAIKRAGELAGEGAVMAKVMRAKQDFRIDIPTVGLKTIDCLQKIGAVGLVLEAEKTFILDGGDFVKEAKKAGITVLARSIEEN